MKVLHSFYSAFYSALFMTALSLTLLPVPGLAGKNVEALPEEMQGIWALTSCDKPDTMLINTKYFNMRIAKDAPNFLLPVMSVDKQQDFYVIKIGNRKTAFHISRTGTLIQNLNPDDVIIGGTPADEWAQFNPDHYVSYAKCKTGIEKHIDPQLTTVMPIIPVLDTFQEYCPIIGREQNIACHDVFFTTFDRDKNGKLNREELTHLDHVTTYMFTHTFKGDYGEDEYDPEEHSTEAFINSMIETFDHDGSVSIDMEEIRNRWDVFSKSQNGRVFMERINTLHKIIAIDSPTRPNNTACTQQQILNNSLAPRNDADIENACTLSSDDGGFLQ